MRNCQLFSAAVVALAITAIAGCGTPSASKPVSSTAAAPISQVMQSLQSQAASFRKLGQ
ncbi:MAG TPA: hypothetical protein V6D47_21020 [Oscillatoriaceae cyanobacterium]